MTTTATASVLGRREMANKISEIVAIKRDFHDLLSKVEHLPLAVASTTSRATEEEQMEGIA